MISACFADQRSGQDGCQILGFGILQFLTTPIFAIGYIWSILHGCELYEKRREDFGVKKYRVGIERERDLEQDYKPKYDQSNI